MTQVTGLQTTDVSRQNLPYSLKCLIDLLSQTKNSTPSQICRILQQTQIQQQDLMPWATFDRPVTHSYGRRAVYNNDYFEIMVMSWLPGDISAIHDHGSAQWGAVQCFGSASHWTYKLNNDLLKIQDCQRFAPNQIIGVNHELIHQMGNMTQNSFLSLHVYGVDRKIASVTGNARVFDLLEESIQYTDGGVFFCLPEADISRREFGLHADRILTLQHHQQMLQRVRSVLQESYNRSEYWQAKAHKLEQKIAWLLNSDPES